MKLSEDEMILEKISNLRPRAFYISIYGACSETHDRVTQVKGSFDKTISAVKKLKNKGISIVFNVMLLTINYAELEEIISLSIQLGVEYRVSMSMIYRNDGSDEPMRYFLNDEEKIKQCLRLAQGSLYVQDKSLDEVEHRGYMCNAGLTTLSIDPKGIVYPCVSLKNPLGSINDVSIKDIWLGAERYKYRNLLLLKNASECGQCDYGEVCPHCVGISQAETGDIYSCNTCDRMLAKCIHELKTNLE